MSDNKESKKLVIITGPQGSGNHLFSKIFNLHPDVKGWDFGDNYWVPSDQEPFAKCWINPKHTKSMLTDQYMVANVSFPFMYNGKFTYPNIQDVIYEAQDAGYEVEVCIVVRDRNINALQQKRVRKMVTLPQAMQYYRTLDANISFLDVEALFLHKSMYLRFVSRFLDFPIDIFNPKVYDITEVDTNNKYVSYVEEYWLDSDVWSGIRSFEERGIDE